MTPIEKAIEEMREPIEDQDGGCVCRRCKAVIDVDFQSEPTALCNECIYYALPTALAALDVAVKALRANSEALPCGCVPCVGQALTEIETLLAERTK